MSREQRQKEEELEKKDYLAIVLAMLTTVLLPIIAFVILLALIVLVFNLL